MIQIEWSSKNTALSAEHTQLIKKLSNILYMVLESEAIKVKAAQTTQKVKFTERAGKFFKGVWSELKKVHWPTKKEAATYTGVVLVAVSIVAVMIWIVDMAFSFVLGFFGII